MMRELLSFGRKLFPEARLALLKTRAAALRPQEVVRTGGFRVGIADGPDYYTQYKDLFIRRIYHFSSNNPRPRIIDGGSNIGMSILYFKSIYPDAAITAFEPDPALFALLRKNLERNNVTGVDAICAGLGPEPEIAEFLPDNSSGGRVGRGEQTIQVRVERLSDYLGTEIDFLKLNIEGEELAVLNEVTEQGKLRQVKELVIEYHGWPGKQQTLHAILELLDANRFRYLVHDFDTETCGASKPPFHISDHTAWYCLIYAKRQAQ